MVHTISRMKAHPTVAVKLDVEKAYDTLRRDFHQACLSKLGFNMNFVSKIMLYVSFVTFIVHVNGSHSKRFRSERGLHQGDPLSPYLYILCVESFTWNCTRLAGAGRLLFLKIAPTGDRVGLLQLANDLLFF